MRADRLFAMAWCAAVLAFAAGDAAAQAIPVQFGAVHTAPVLPEGKGEWMLQVISRGGFDGRGAGDFTVTSGGALSCADLRRPCPSSLDRTDLRTLEALIRQAPQWDWVGSALSTTCRDCYSTLLMLTVRDDAGELRTLVAYWDPTTRARLPREITRLHDIGLSLRR